MCIPKHGVFCFQADNVPQTQPPNPMDPAFTYLHGDSSPGIHSGPCGVRPRWADRRHPVQCQLQPTVHRHHGSHSERLRRRLAARHDSQNAPRASDLHRQGHLFFHCIQIWFLSTKRIVCTLSRDCIASGLCGAMPEDSEIPWLQRGLRPRRRRQPVLRDPVISALHTFIDVVVKLR